MRRLDRRDDIDDVFNRMQNVFSQFQDLADMSPGMPVNVKEEDEKIVVSADMPGVEKEDINLKADSEGIEISAESTEEFKEENEKYFRQERSSRKYRRTVSWPTPVDPETIRASYEDGVLTVEAEKEESEGWDVEIE